MDYVLKNNVVKTPVNESLWDRFKAYIKENAWVFACASPYGYMYWKAFGGVR